MDTRAMQYILDYNNKQKIVNGNSLKAHIHSFGCQQNISDAEVLEGILCSMGYQLTEDQNDADFVIFNTCAVRETAENTVLGALGNLKKAKELNPNMIIAVCGCMTQQKHISEKIAKSYSHVDLMFGAGAMDTLPNILEEKLKTGDRVLGILSPTRDIAEDLPINRRDKAKAYIPVMSGCNNFCTYCVVPYVRGRERSREFKLIIEECKKLIDCGYKEITLLGQNVNSYGINLQEKHKFSELIKAISLLNGDFLLRFMTSHPKDCDNELIDTMSSSEKIAKHLHLPVQSGSNKVLDLMNRGYTKEQYLEKIDYARSKIPGISFTSDIIIGFPTESERDFQFTYDLVEKVGFSALYTFAYSPRSGTKAAEIENLLTEQEKKDRFERILLLQRRKSNEFNSQLVGKKFRALVENTYKEDMLSGRFDNNVVVVFNGNKNLIGNFVEIIVEDFMDWAVKGRLATINKKEKY